MSIENENGNFAKPMLGVVLSLFDGMSCGQIALNRAGISYGKYYASEIDKHAIKVTQHNYPDTIQIGSVTEIKGTDLPQIDLLIGGSPCQGFSFAGKGLNFDDPRSKLFFEFVRILKETKPKYFLLENVKMKQEFQDIISEQLGVKPILINSSLVSAQNRERLYWTNIPLQGLPNDKGLFLKDIIEKGAGKKLSEQTAQRPRTLRNYRSENQKAFCMLATMWKGSQSNGMTVIEDNGLRNITPLECERLQTVPDNEIICIFTSCLDQVKNYVNAVEKNPKLLKLALSAEKEELNEFVKLVTQNTKQNHQKTRFIVPQNADMTTWKQTNQCTLINQKESNTTVNNVGNIVMRKSQNQEEAFVLQNAFINIIEGRIMRFGKEELLLKDKNCTNQMGGNKPLVLFGKEIMQLVKDVDAGMKKRKDMSSTSTILSVLSISSLEQMLATYYLFAKSVITGFTQNTTSLKSLSIQFQINDGYTSCVSNTQRYTMLGNGWTVDVIAHIFGGLS